MRGRPERQRQVVGGPCRPHPAAAGGSHPGSERWLIAEMVPGAHPFVELEGALLRLGVGGSPALLDVLRADEVGVLRATKQILPPDVDLVLLIHQLEEVFTLVVDEQERTLFLAGMAELARNSTRARAIVATLRADFYDRPLLYPGFADLMRSYIEPVVPLDPDELELAIRWAGTTTRGRPRAGAARGDAAGDLGSTRRPSAAAVRPDRAV